MFARHVFLMLSLLSIEGCKQRYAIAVADDQAAAPSLSRTALRPTSIAPTAAPSASPIALAPLPPGLHVMTLPPLSWDEEFAATSAMDMAPGEPPGPRHAAGTVYVAQSDAEEAQVNVTEWDLATGKKLRRTDLKAESGGFARIIRAGDHLHVAAWEWDGNVSYARLTRDLRVEREQVIGTVIQSHVLSLASDGSLTFIVATGFLGDLEKWRSPSKPPHGTYGVTFDGSGQKVGARILEAYEIGSYIHDGAAVVGGRAYALHGPRSSRGDVRYQLLELLPDLSVVRDIPLPTGADVHVVSIGTKGATVLYPVRDHLVLDTGDAPVLELSTAGVERGRRPACPKPGFSGAFELDEGTDLWVGDVHAGLFYGKRGKGSVVWADPGTFGPPPPPPCRTVRQTWQ
jgi:hypothetical protein